MQFSFPKMKQGDRPLINLLIVQLMTGIMLVPLYNFGGIYLNEVLQLSVGDVAIIIALGQIMGMIASLMGGSLGDRWGYKGVLFIGGGGIIIGSLLYLTDVPVLVILLWCTTHAGLGLSTVSSQGYLTLASRPEILGLSSALYNWGYTVGGTVGIPIATVILGENNYMLLGSSLVIFGLFMIFRIGFLPVLHTKSPREPSENDSGGYHILFRKRFIMLGLLRFLPTCYYGLMTLFPIIIKQQSGSNVAVAGFVAWSSIFASLTQLLAGYLADRWGVKLPAQLAFFMMLIAIFGSILTAHTLTGLYFFGGLGISAAWALSTLLPGMVTAVTEPEIRGRVFGMLHLLWALAMASGTLLGGNLLEVNIQLPFIIVGILNIFSLIIMHLLFDGQSNTMQNA